MPINNVENWSLLWNAFQLKFVSYRKQSVDRVCKRSHWFLDNTYFYHDILALLGQNIAQNMCKLNIDQIVQSYTFVLIFMIESILLTF